MPNIIKWYLFYKQKKTKHFITQKEKETLIKISFDVTFVCIKCRNNLTLFFI